MKLARDIPEYREDGTYRTVLGKLDQGRVTLKPQGLEVHDPRLVYYKDDVPQPIELPVQPVELDGNPIYIVAIIDGKPWLVATEKHWVWN